MTKSRAKELLKRFHPDKAGNNRYIAIVQKAVDSLKRKYNHCLVCGTTTSGNAKRCMAHRRSPLPQLDL